jgi:hypothetical protein
VLNGYSPLTSFVDHLSAEKKRRIGSRETPGQSFTAVDDAETLAQEGTSQSLPYYCILESKTEIDITPDAQKDDIRVEYHPKSGRASTTVSFGEFRREEADRNRAPAHDTPWQLFGSRVNFEFAELAQQSLMNQGQIDAMIKLFRRCIDLGINSPEAFTLSSAKELSNIWTLAAETITPASTAFIIPHPAYFAHLWF